MRLQVLDLSFSFVGLPYQSTGNSAGLSWSKPNPLHRLAPIHYYTPINRRNPKLKLAMIALSELSFGISFWHGESYFLLGKIQNCRVVHELLLNNGFRASSYLPHNLVPTEMDEMP
jgi:hypothetical protein